MTSAILKRYRPLNFRGPFDLAPPVAAPWSHRQHPYKFARHPVVVPKARLIDMLGTGLIYMDPDIASPVRNAHTLSRIGATAGNNIFRVSGFRSVSPIHDTLLDSNWPLFTAGPDAALAGAATPGDTGVSGGAGDVGGSSGADLTIGKMQLTGSTLVFVAIAGALALWAISK
ncbi:MAG TPA: hypothetical protein VKR31_10125 [Rhizomicrobium sp.]|nr:hypothetical protein [Rhizomicrobium sp.]